MTLPKVTIVGAGHVGATTAHVLALRGTADIVLVDIAEGLPQGKALDMMHARSVERFGPTVTGTNDYADTSGSDVVVITAGLPRKPGMTREDLLRANADIVRGVVERARESSPDAVLLCVTNPLDVMTHLAWRTSGLPPERVLGMGGVLDSARFAYAIAEETGAHPSAIEALVVGAHGEAMAPLPRLSTVDGRPLTEVVDEATTERLVERTVRGGAEVVGLLRSGSAYYAPASSIAAMVGAILEDTGAVMPSCVLLRGEFGIEGVCLSVPVELGAGGVRRIVALELEAGENAALQDAAESVRRGIAALGEGRGDGTDADSASGPGSARR